MLPKLHQTGAARPGHGLAGTLLGLALAALLAGCGGPADHGTSGGPVTQTQEKDKPPPAAPRPWPPTDGAETGPNQPQPHPPPKPPPVHRPQPIVAKPAQLKPDLFKTVQATDGTFSLKIPSDWTTEPFAMATGTNFWSPKGEWKRSYLEPVTDPQALQLLGQPVTPKVSRLLSPVDVVKTYGAQVGPPLAQNIKVLEARELSDAEKRILGQLGQKGAVIHYQYTLTPKKGTEAQRRQLPPPLRDQNEVAMEGEAWVATLQLAASPAWSYQVDGVEAPADVFRKNRVLYDVIARSAKDDPAAIARITGQNIQAQQGITDAIRTLMTEQERSSDAYSALMQSILGDQIPYYDEQNNQIYTIPSDQQRGGGTVVGPGGRELRPATVEDIKRTLPSLLPRD